MITETSYYNSLTYFNWAKAFENKETQNGFTEVSKCFRVEDYEGEFVLSDFDKRFLIAFLIYKIYNPDVEFNEVKVLDVYNESMPLRKFLYINDHVNNSLPKEYLGALVEIFLEKIDFDKNQEALYDFYLDEQIELSQINRFSYRSSYSSTSLASEVKSAYENFIRIGYKLKF